MGIKINCMFKVGDLVVHVKTGGLYEILMTPEQELLLERDKTPAYLYRKVNSEDLRVWVRDSDEMEDGRFRLENRPISRATTTTEQHHVLKTDSEVFQAVRSGAKTFEIRLNDRGFAVGDCLELRETTYTGAEMKAGAPLYYTGRVEYRHVSHVLTGYGLMDGWCCLSFARPDFHTTASPAVVWCVQNRTAVMLFATENLARQFVSEHSPALGLQLSSIPVIGNFVISPQEISTNPMTSKKPTRDELAQIAIRTRNLTAKQKQPVTSDNEGQPDLLYVSPEIYDQLLLSTGPSVTVDDGEVHLPSAAEHVLKISQAVRKTDTHEMLVEVIKRELQAYAKSVIASRALSAVEPDTVPTSPWPVVTRFSGGASPEGVGRRVWILMDDDGPEVEYAPVESQTAPPVKSDTVSREEFDNLLKSEHALSDAYVRLRLILGAMNPPSVTDTGALYNYVENFAREKMNALTTPVGTPTTPIVWRYREGPAAPRSIAAGEPGPWHYHESHEKPDCAWEGVEFEPLCSATAQLPQVVTLVKQDPDSWEANAQHLLERCPYTIWQHPGGSLPDLKSTLVVTFQGMQMRLEGHPMYARKLVSEQTTAQELPIKPNWRTPTSFLQRFEDAVALLCNGNRPPVEMVEAWLDTSREDHRLQDWAAEHSPAWAQGIVLLDAARIIADTPTEGVDHEPSPVRVAESAYHLSAEEQQVLKNAHHASVDVVKPRLTTLFSDERIDAELTTMLANREIPDPTTERTAYWLTPEEIRELFDRLYVPYAGKIGDPYKAIDFARSRVSKDMEKALSLFSEAPKPKSVDGPWLNKALELALKCEIKFSFCCEGTVPKLEVIEAREELAKHLLLAVPSGDSHKIEPCLKLEEPLQPDNQTPIAEVKSSIPGRDSPLRNRPKPTSWVYE